MVHHHHDAILTTIQILVFVLYNGYMLWYTKGKILPSISESWYVLKDPKNALFTMFCYLLGISMVFRTDASPLYFLSGAGFVFTGAATKFKMDDVRPVHFVSATIAIIAALMGNAMVKDAWTPLILWVFLSYVMARINVPNLLYWVEMLAFVCLVVGFIV
jgi:hypothetical protein